MPITMHDQHTINWEAFHEHVKRIPIAQVLDLLGVDTSPLDKGRSAHVLCPCHADKGPSLYVHQDENWGYCFGACNRAYGVAALFAKANNIGILDAYDQLGQLFGIDPENVTPLTSSYTKTAKPSQPAVIIPPSFMSTALGDLYHKQLTTAEYQMFERDWLLPAETVQQMHIGHTLRKDRPAAWTIPVWGDEPGGGLWTMRYRRDDAVSPGHPNKYWGEMGRNGLYPFAPWLAEIENEYCWLVESEKTGLVGATYGYPFLTLTGGVSGHPDAWAYSYKHLLEKYRFIVAAHDDDEAGALAAEKLWRLFPGRVVRFPWPTTQWGGKDPLDHFKLFGIENFLKRSALAVEEHKGAIKKEVVPDLNNRRHLFGWRDVQPIEWVG